jgi:hypothetical protein
MKLGGGVLAGAAGEDVGDLIVFIAVLDQSLDQSGQEERPTVENSPGRSTNPAHQGAAASSSPA